MHNMLPSCLCLADYTKYMYVYRIYIYAIHVTTMSRLLCVIIYNYLYLLLSEFINSKKIIFNESICNQNENKTTIFKRVLLNKETHIYHAMKCIVLHFHLLCNFVVVLLPFKICTNVNICFIFFFNILQNSALLWLKISQRHVDVFT